MQLRDVLQLECFAGTRVVPGCDRLDRPLRWVHVVDLPDPRPWVKTDQLILSTGYALGPSAAEQAAFVRRLVEAGACGLALAVPQRFDRVPDAMIAEAAASGLPLLEVPWEVPFADITEQVHRALIAEQNRFIERSEEVHRVLTRAAVTRRSLHDLVRTLGDLLHRSAIIEDADGSLLASHTIAGMNDGPRRETLATGHVSTRYAAYVRSLDLAAPLSEGAHAVRVPGSEDGTIAPRVVCSIRLLQEHIGFIWIIEGGRPLTELDIRAAEHAAVLAALHVAHERDLHALEKKVGSGFVDSILEGRFKPTPSGLERARLWGFAADAPYVLAMAVLPENPPLSERGLLQRDQVASDVRARLKRLDLPILLTENLNRIFFLLPSHVAPLQLEDLASHHDLRVVVSDLVVGPAQIRRAYKNLQRIERHLAAGSVHHYRDFLVPRVLHGDAEAHQDLIDAIVRPLLDAGKGSSLVDTLHALVRANFVFSHAALALGIHLSTLRYRIERIEGVLDASLGDPDVRFMTQMACYLSRESMEFADPSS